MKMKSGLFFLVLISFTGSDDIICPSKTVNGEVGNSITLGCHLGSKSNVLGDYVKWKFNGSHDVILYRSQDFSYDGQAEQFKDRATLDKEQLAKGNLTVKILRVNKNDSGIYTCSLGPEHKQISCKVHLIVEDPSNKSEDGNQTGNTGHIVGGVVGGVVVAALVAIAVWWK